MYYSCWTHLLSVSLHHLVPHIIVVFRLHTYQFINELRLGGGTEGSAVFQRLLPGLILLYQDHLVPIAGAGKKINRVLDSHIFTGGGDGDTVTILHWLMVCPVCIIWHTCLPCRIGGEISATKITTNQLNVMSKKIDELEREARKKYTL